MLRISKPHDVFPDRPVILVGLGLHLQISQREVTDLPFLLGLDDNTHHFIFPIQPHNLHGVADLEGASWGTLVRINVIHMAMI
jgi:hypothetical protein